MAKATKEETKVIEMENKIEKMTQFLGHWSKFWGWAVT